MTDLAYYYLLTLHYANQVAFLVNVCLLTYIGFWGFDMQRYAEWWEQRITYTKIENVSCTDHQPLTL